ncbi:MAG: endonuclease/exonuclease/phosphatase family protein [Planctomycetota bacterium]|jgi:parallel beta-helix repeat protein
MESTHFFKSVLMLLVFVFCSLIAGQVHGATIIVKADGSGDYPTIQAAIDDANDGDEIVLEPGTYIGWGNRDIDFKGKPITVRSTNPEDPGIVAGTVIDCYYINEHSFPPFERWPGRGFHFHSGEDANSILAGVTITNGLAPIGQRDWPVPYFYSFGGGVLCDGSSPTITRCRIIGNEAACTIGYNFSRGGGICGHSGSMPVINRCTITGNSAYGVSGSGGGLYGCHGPINNCIITGNSAIGGSGGGMSGCRGPVSNCTITGNYADDSGGGVCLRHLYNSTISNCILVGNEAENGPQVALLADPTPPVVTFSYSDIEGGEGAIHVESGCTLNWGAGNIDADPCFVESGYWGDANDPNIIVEPNDPNAIWVEGDYHLLLVSPCVDAGDPDYVAGPNETDLDGNPRVTGEAIDMGAYEAAISPYEIAVASMVEAIAEKEQMLEEVGRMLEGENQGYYALEELLESGDYSDLKKGEIVKAKQKLHSAIQHQKQCGDALGKSIVKLEDALASLGWESEQGSIKSKSFDWLKLVSVGNKRDLPNLDADANGAISQPYEIAVASMVEAIAEKEQMLEAVDEALEKEERAYDALEELLESGDYGDLKKGDIVKAKLKVHSAIEHEEQSQKKLEKGIEKLQDALECLGWEPEQRSIKVMTFNMWGGGDNWNKCVEAIENSGADIIGLQEASNFVGIANSLGFYYDEGTWTLSRYPITAVQGWGYGQAVTIALPSGQDVYVFNCHLPAYPYGPYELPDVEAALEAELQAQWPVLNVILDNMISYIATGKPCFLTGDFNVASHLDYANVPWKCSQECVTAGLTDSYRSVHPENRTYPPSFAYDEPGITWTPKPSQEPYDVYDRIDFVYSSNSVVCTASEELDSRNSVSPWPSDHRAVVSTFIVESPAPTTKASNPIPPNGAENVNINVELNWSAGAGAISHDVYFGTNPTPGIDEFQGNQDGTTFVLSTLEYLTTYYWRIDEVSNAGTETGDLWSFTTQDVGPELSLDKDVYIGGEPIFASFWNGPGNTTDWIGIYQLGQVPGSVSSTVWLYTNGMQWPEGSGPTDGSVEFNNLTGAPSWPLTEGDWAAYFLCCDGYFILAGPVVFYVE